MLIIMLINVNQQVYQGLLQRDIRLVVNVTGQQGDTLDILVENMGRVNFGSKINDYKARNVQGLKNKKNCVKQLKFLLWG